MPNLTPKTPKLLGLFSFEMLVRYLRELEVSLEPFSLIVFKYLVICFSNILLTIEKNLNKKANINKISQTIT